jgi:uncharacterized DUF497 family protein
MRDHRTLDGAAAGIVIAPALRSGALNKAAGNVEPAALDSGHLRLVRVNRTLMNDDAFEWDDAKAAENYAKHGVDFETARQVFRDPFAVERTDDREHYGEDRFTLTGIADGVVLTVVYTERDGRLRLISARRATRREQDDYFAQNA